MITCPHCGVANRPEVVFCVSCKLNLHFTGELRLSDGANTKQSHRINKFSHSKAIGISFLHFVVSSALLFIVSLTALGAGLSDAYHGDGIGLFGIALVLLQAPLVIIGWCIKMFGNYSFGLSKSAMLAVGIFSSLVYGYIIAFLWRGKSDGS